MKSYVRDQIISTIKLKFVLQLIQVIKKEGRYNGIRRKGGWGGAGYDLYKIQLKDISLFKTFKEIVNMTWCS